MQTEDIHVLAGICSDEGKREKGVLDAYFSSADVSLLLSQAAEKCYRDAKDRGGQSRAASLALVAGDFEKVVEMLSALISPAMDVRNDDKRFWYEQSKRFFDLHLTKSTYVISVLEKNGRRQSVDTLKVMIQLYEFFCCIADGKFHDAWSMLDRLDILPASKSQVGEKSMRYNHLDLLVQQKVPSIMVAAMKSYYHEHSRLKSELHTGPKSTIESAMTHLKGRAEAIMSFAGVVSGMSEAQREDIARVEASMI